MKLPPGHVPGGVVKPKCTGGFGERLMRSMGWDAGQGLGKEGTGITEAIQVKKKEDTVGVGGNGSYDWGGKWWEKAFDSAAQTVDDSDSGGSSSDSSDSDSDDEEDERDMAAIVAAVNRDGTKASATADELKLLASLSKAGGSRLAAGRFGGRDAKMQRIRQQEAREAAQAAAKLGGRDASGGGARSDRSDTTSELRLGGSGGAGDQQLQQDGEQSQAQPKKKKKTVAATKGAEEQGQRGGGEQGAAADQRPQQQQEEGPKRRRIVIEPAAAGPNLALNFKQTPATGWWGESRFASAGCLEGLDSEAAEAARRRTEFTEDTQAAIYNDAQAKKTQGKVGLGQGTGTVKVGGVKWEGKRVSFEEEQQEAADTDTAADAGAPGATGALGSSSRLAALGGCETADAAAAVQGWADAVKWKKVIVAQLAAAEQGQLRVRELEKAVVSAVLAKHGSVVLRRADVKAAFAVRLQAGSSKWVLEGRRVRLSS